ncbi:MAG: endolytic transglycosylase MltG [Gammaproteobacteria bacterium]
MAGPGRRAILVALLLIGLCVGGARFWTGLQEHLDRPLQLAGTSVDYTVVPGASIGSISRDLALADILMGPGYLVIAARLSGKAGRIQAGEYALTQGLTPRRLLDHMIEGRVVQHRLTLIEGWSFDAVCAALAGHPKVKQTLDGLSRAEATARLYADARDPEGRFYPDTYRFPAGTTDIAILRMAEKRMDRKLARAWARRAPDLPYRRPYEALVMASIIEKETAAAAERPVIAGVFVRRLERGMPLQADPSVIYALGAGFDGDLRRSHLEIESPYNTYRHAGLPPTPIAMPGEASLHAAFHPAGGDTLYFVAKGDGHHHFSTTLEEHNRAVAAYQSARTQR